jgi:hypothetical protein
VVRRAGAHVPDVGDSGACSTIPLSISWAHHRAVQRLAVGYVNECEGSVVKRMVARGKTGCAEGDKLCSDSAEQNREV